MTKVSHQLTGFSLGAMLSVLTGDVGYFPGVFLGSVLPDLDLLWNERGKYSGGKWYGHRGITHSLLTGLILVGVAVLVLKLGSVSFGSFSLSFGGSDLVLRGESSVELILPEGFILGTLAGYWLHLFLDMLSPTGIPVGFSYYPRIRFRVYKTGSPQEFLVAVVVSALFMTVAVVRI